MPIYEFKCEECQTVSTMTMKMSDPHPEVCPSCQKGALRKLISPSSFMLTGGGWFADSYGKKPTSSSEEAPACAKKNENNPACCQCPAAGSSH